MSLRCRLGLHDFPWPPHRYPSFSLWEDFNIECARGCGARTRKRCHNDQHWVEKHPEPDQGGMDAMTPDSEMRIVECPHCHQELAVEAATLDRIAPDGREPLTMGALRDALTKLEHADGDTCTGLRCTNPDHGWLEAEARSTDTTGPEWDDVVAAIPLDATHDLATGRPFGEPATVPPTDPDEPCAKCGTWRRFHGQGEVQGPEYSRDHEWVPVDALGVVLDREAKE